MYPDDDDDDEEAPLDDEGLPIDGLSIDELSTEEDDEADAPEKWGRPGSVEGGHDIFSHPDF